MDSSAAARAAIGKRVEVAGVAGNAKLAAVVMAGDLVLYCLDRTSWPSGVVGKQVTVRGTLEHTEEFQATTSPTGEISQGTEGAVFVLRKSELVPAP